jgi:hypothetical protein
MKSIIRRETGERAGGGRQRFVSANGRGRLSLFSKPNTRDFLGLKPPPHAFRKDTSPADLAKQAASFDLPITVGILAGGGHLASDRFDAYAVVGELTLDGTMRPIAAQCSGRFGVLLTRRAGRRPLGRSSQPPQRKTL